MKRLLVLFLCLPLLLCSCHKINHLETGETYYADGVWQNTCVEVVVTADDWTVPLESLTYTVYNETDFDIRVKVKYLSIEAYRDGQWIVISGRESLDADRIGFTCKPHEHGSDVLSLTALQQSDDSVYRVRVPYLMKDLPDDLEYAAEAIGYFTITPEPDAEETQ